ncbi:MAG: hypothetical protein HYR64_09630 [Fimbriimonas ginsengisoli]|uniref:Uncharacterized protein n=1 Tax=Fimbriimonas ginsengisoli TaxID=1005039 RepID=A0A931LU19_FIMGI|nr:hypothetical protein [Fimbriimonas ginsengisoli]
MALLGVSVALYALGWLGPTRPFLLHIGAFGALLAVALFPFMCGFDRARRFELWLVVAAWAALVGLGAVSEVPTAMLWLFLMACMGLTLGYFSAFMAAGIRLLAYTGLLILAWTSWGVWRVAPAQAEQWFGPAGERPLGLAALGATLLYAVAFFRWAHHYKPKRISRVTLYR